MLRNNENKRIKINLNNNTYKKRISIFFVYLTILLGIIITSSYLIFKGNEEEAKPKILAYIYDGVSHEAPPARDSGYEIDVVNCDMAVGTWDNEKWTLSLSNIEGKANCILNFKEKIPSHTLVIDPNGGTYKGSTGTTTITLKEGSTYEIENPTRKGYTFNGWEKESQSSQIDGTSFVMGEENEKLTAKWSINSYEVTISGTNMCDKTVTVEYNSRVELCEVTRDGYTFIGWEVTSGEVDGNELIVSDANASVSPKWQINNYGYIVQHKIEGLNGTYSIKESETGNAEFNTSVSPETKTYTGFTSPARQTKTITSGDNTIVYQYTRNSYTLTINPNGGSTTTELSQTLKYQQQVTVVSPTKTGYNFTGWTKTSGTLQDTTFTIGASNATLTANYQAKTSTLYFDANQGSVSLTQKSVTYDQQYGELPSATRTGYTFDGWYLSGVKIEPTTIVKIESTTSVVAHWTKNSYTLSINPNGGTYNNSPSVNEQNLDYEDEYTVSDPVREGYTFDGWTLSGTGATYNSSTKVFKMGSSNATLTAKWTVNTYKLTISGTNVCDGTQYLDYQDTYELCVPQKTGHTFAGWEDEDNLIQNNIVTMKAKNSSITAKWTANTYNYIVYHNKMDLDGENYTRVDADTYSSSAEYGTVVVTEAKTYTGFKSQSNKSITIGIENNNPPTTNVAEYNYEREKYSVTVNPNGGTYNSSTSSTTHSKIYYQDTYTISNPSRTGYNFSGWTVAGTESSISSTTFTMGSENATLTAGWTAKTFTVSFNANGGSVSTSSKTVTYDSTYGDLPTPTRSNYDFQGWFTAASGGTKITSSSTVNITDVQTLYAQWKLKTYTITYNANGGSVSPSSTTVDHGGTISSLATPTRSGYTFLGWYTLSSGGTKITTSTTFTSAQTIYAQWYLIENAVTKITNLASSTSQLQYDGTTNNNIRYVGANPNNYVQFNGELWRIIGVMNGIKTSAGSTKSLLKIIRKDMLAKYSNSIYAWDASVESINQNDGINQWGASGSYEGADLMRELNTDYLGNVTVGTDGMWYTSHNYKTTMPDSKLNSNAQSLIETVVWNVGAANCNNGTYIYYQDTSLTPALMYTNERGNSHGKICTAESGTFYDGSSACNDTVTRTTTWTGKVALMYPSDYLFATSGGSTKSRSACVSTYQYNWGTSSYSDCKNNDWLFDSTQYIWTLSPLCSDTYANLVHYIGGDGDVGEQTADNSRGVRPVVYTKSTTNIINGTGTSSDPYVLG